MSIPASPARRIKRIGWERKEKPTPSPSLKGGVVLLTSGLAISGRTVKKTTSAKMIHETESMKLVGLMSNNAADAMSPRTVKRNIRSVWVKYGLS